MQGYIILGFICLALLLWWWFKPMGFKTKEGIEFIERMHEAEKTSQAKQCLRNFHLDNRPSSNSLRIRKTSDNKTHLSRRDDYPHRDHSMLPFLGMGSEGYGGGSSDDSGGSSNSGGGSSSGSSD